MSDDLTDQIKEAAAEPKRASVDGQSVEGRSIDELVTAQKFLKSQEATKSPHKGLTFSKFVPPGAG